MGDANASIPKSIIEPKYARVNIDTISAKEARRVLNNRKSAHKSYLRKKEVNLFLHFSFPEVYMALSTRGGVLFLPWPLALIFFPFERSIFI